MLKVGLTGGYATGKSFVARRLSTLGCFVIYADALGHQALAPSGEAYQPVLDWFGSVRPGIELRQPDSTLNRRKLASFVFEDAALLTQLNALVHPAVFRLEEQALIGFESQNSTGIAVIEAAILIETGRYKLFDRLVVTSCPADLQIQRAMERDGITVEQARQRIARQLSNAERVRFADHVVDTGGTGEQTIKQIDTLFVQLRQLAEARIP